MRTIRGWIKHIDFMIIDAICLEASLFIMYILRNEMILGIVPQSYRNLATVIILMDICVAFLRSSYKDIIYRGYLIEFRETAVHCTSVMIGIIIWMFIIKESSYYSRMVIIGMYLLSIMTCYVCRSIWKYLVRIRIKGNKQFRRLIVISTSERIENIIEGLILPYSDYSVTGIALLDSNNRIGNSVLGVPIVTGSKMLIQYMQENIIDEVFIDLPNDGKLAEKIMHQVIGMGITAHINLFQFGGTIDNKRICSIGQYIVASSSMRFTEPWQMFMKRCVDILGSMFGLLITGIAFLVFAPIIYFQSPGPVFFSQKRVGRNGRVFKIYKFRTMYLDAEKRKSELLKFNKMRGFMFKMENDPRIIPIGHFLREKSIDELPQFWNILKGDMSLVGTRPPTVDEYNHYEIQHKKRLAMKPGLTGLWQVTGRNNIVDFDEVVALDSKYITEWTLVMDIKIIWKTIAVIIRGKGAL